jgi:hypothetical protein
MVDSPHYVTPEEAEKKYCPLKYSECVGSKCMAWRWRLMRYAEEKDPETDSWPAIYSTTHGCCGMVKQ